MDFFEAVYKRHSYRDEFESTGVPKEDIVKILDAGIRAASGMNYQPVNFIAVMDPEKRRALHALMPKKTTATAPVMIVVITTKMESPKGMSFEREDYAAAVENVLLAVTALGYASVWIDGETHLEGRDEAIAKLLDVPEGWHVRCLLPVGVPKKQLTQAEKKPFEERVRFE